MYLNSLENVIDGFQVEVLTLKFDKRDDQGFAQRATQGDQKRSLDPSRGEDNRHRHGYRQIATKNDTTKDLRAMGRIGRMTGKLEKTGYIQLTEGMSCLSQRTKGLQATV